MTKAKSTAPAAASFLERQQAAEILAVLTCGAGGSPEAAAKTLAKALGGSRKQQREGCAALLRRFDELIGSFEAQSNGHILDAEQRADIAVLWDGLNSLYIALASALDEGGREL